MTTRFKGGVLLFQIAWGIWIFAQVVEETSIASSAVRLATKALTVLAFLLFIASELCARRLPERRAAVIWLAILACMAVSCVASRSYVLMQGALIIFFSRSHDKRPLFEIALHVLGIVSALVVLAVAFGVIDPNVIGADTARGGRSSIGFAWPSRLPNIILTMATLWLLVRGDFKLTEMGVVLFVGLLVYGITGSRAPLLTLLIMVALVAMNKIRALPVIKLWLPASLSFVIFGIITIWPALAFDPSVQWMHDYDLFMSHRLLYSHNAFASIGLSLFGTPLFNDGVATYATGYLDAGYLRLLFTYGIVPFVIAMVAYTLLLYSACKEGRTLLVIALVCLTVHACFEGHLIWLQFVPFMLYLSELSIDGLRAKPHEELLEDKKPQRRSVGRGSASPKA